MQYAKNYSPFAKQAVRRSDVYRIIMEDLESIGVLQNVNDIDTFKGPTEANKAGVVVKKEKEKLTETEPVPEINIVPETETPPVEKKGFFSKK